MIKRLKGIRRHRAATGLLALAALLTLTGAGARAAVIGPGDTTIDANDTAADLLAVDLTNPVTLAAGTHMASLFHYQFSEANGPIGGTITPVLLTGSAPSFTPVAVGATIPFAGPTAFISAPFGGSDTFTLAASTTVYAGVFWNGDFGTDTMPVGFLDGVGDAYVFFQDAAPPAVGVPSSGDNEGRFSRTYDFSIETDASPAAAVPEPSTLVLAGTGLLGLGAVRRRKRAV